MIYGVNPAFEHFIWRFGVRINVQLHTGWLHSNVDV